MKKIIIYLFVVSLFILNTSCFAIENAKTQYDMIYESLPEINIEYWQNEDPEESYDSMGYIVSPYPLIRISEELKVKTLDIKPSYYLLTPKTDDGFDFVMFKQKGKISALVPVYEKKEINPDKIYPKEEKAKKPPKSIGKRIADCTILLPYHILKTAFWPFKKAFGWMFPKKKPLKPFRCKLDTQYVQGGKYYQMDLYVEKYLYKMLFEVKVP